MTGGDSYQRQATVYSPTGWIRDLPLLKEKRQHHACAKFYDENGKTVPFPIRSVATHFTKFYFLQTLLVTGGAEKYNGDFDSLDSTEILRHNAGAWSVLNSAKLPAARHSLAAATLNNRVYIFGKERYLHF